MKNPALPKVVSSDEAWDDGSLGRDATYAKKVTISASHRAKLESKLNLQAISIRLPEELLADLKAIANMNGLGYQPLIRQILTRFAHAELKAVAREAMGATENSNPPCDDQQVESERPHRRHRKAA
jgi:predicted DNA binding CopG/RHH family protein